MRLQAHALVAVACCALITADPAMAQSQGGLYGATRSDGGGRNKLSAQVFVSEAFNSGIPSELRPFVQENQQFGRHSTLFAATADYARNRSRAQVFGRASTFFRYAPDLSRMASVSHQAEAGADVRMPNKGSLKIAQTASFSPPYLYQLFPSAAPITPGDTVPVNAAYRTESNSYRTTMDLSFASTGGTRVTTTAQYSVDDFKEPAAASDVTTYGTGARLDHPLSRTQKVSVGYQYLTGDFASHGRTHEHRLTMGVSYAPALSPTRRLSLRLDVTPSVIQGPVGVDAAEGSQPHLQAEATVAYPFRPKWRAEASYSRTLEYVPGLSEPVLSGGTRVTVTGVIGWRLDISALAGRARAAAALSDPGRTLGTYTGEARVRYALSRAYAVYSEYVYFNHDLGQMADFVPGIPNKYSLHEIRVGFTFFTQVFPR